MHLTHRGYFIIIIMAFIFGLAGCHQEGPAEKAGKKVDQTTESTVQKIDEAIGKAGEILDDSAITAKIKAEILSDPLLKVFQISVTTTDNVVMLSGVVDSQQSIDRAVEIAHGVKNVKSVNNDLVVE